MTESTRATVTLLILLIALSVCGWLGMRYKDNADRVDKAEQQAEQATAIATNVINAVTLFNGISQATSEEKQRNSDESSVRVAVIKSAVKDDECAKRVVPAAAVNSLREHRNKIHSGSASPDPGKSAG